MEGRTVKTATEMVARVNRYEDRYSNRGGGLAASLRLQARMSRVMTLLRVRDKDGMIERQV